MSWDDLAWVAGLEIHPTGRKFVLHILASYANQDGFAYCGQEKLAAVTSQGLSTVRRHLDGLIEDGLIVRERRFGKVRGRLVDGFVLQRSTAQTEQINRPYRADQPPKLSRSTAQTEQPYNDEKELTRNGGGGDWPAEVLNLAVEVKTLVGGAPFGQGDGYVTIQAWLRDGAHPERHVLRTIQEVLAKRGGLPPSSLRYFTAPIARAKAAEDKLQGKQVLRDHAPSGGSAFAHPGTDSGMSRALEDAIREVEDDDG